MRIRQTFICPRTSKVRSTCPNQNLTCPGHVGPCQNVKLIICQLSWRHWHPFFLTFPSNLSCISRSLHLTGYASAMQILTPPPPPRVTQGILTKKMFVCQNSRTCHYMTLLYSYSLDIYWLARMLVAVPQSYYHPVSKIYLSLLLNLYSFSNWDRNDDETQNINRLHCIAYPQLCIAYSHFY